MSADRQMRRKLAHYKARTAELERLLTISKLQASTTVENPDEDFTPLPRILPMTESNANRSKYIDYLHQFADLKCAEAEQLMTRLNDHRNHEIAIRLEMTESLALKPQNSKLAVENKRLKSEISRIQSQLSDFVVRHREEKAARKLARLEQLAALRKEMEKRDLELYGFILSELSHCIDGNPDVDEESARKAVIKAAALLKRAFRTRE